MNNLNKGVFYSPDDYAGFLRRMLCLIIDVSILILLLILIIYLKDPLQEYGFLFIIFLFWFIFAILYLSIIKSSKYKTIGYWILGLKIVDHYGNKPSNIKMLFRLLVSLLGPFELPFDIFWLFEDSKKQTLRDKFSGTYVIKNDAIPKGSSKIKAYYYFIHGWSFLFQEVKNEI